jgi:MFS family permease
MENEPEHLSRVAAQRGMRGFITASGFWGFWGQGVGIGTAVFTGFALHLGADESFIALFTSMAYFLAFTQLFSSLYTTRLRQPKRFILGAGFTEILLRGAPLLVPFVLAAHLQLSALTVLVALSLLCGYSISPLYSTWVANTVPEHIRARFTSRQTIVSTMAALVSGFLLGQFVDFFPADEKGTAFTWVMAGCTLFGLAGYMALGRAPYPPKSPTSVPAPKPRDLLKPFGNRRFLVAVLFFGLWTFAIGIGGPLYSVFMLERLGISYTSISIFNGLFMLTSIAGYRIWAVLADRFGSKPVLQILLVPACFIPFIWIFNRPDAYLLVPIALIVSGLVFSGIGVSITPMLYGLLPEGEERPIYLASWSATVNLLGAMGPLAGSFLVGALEGVRFELMGFPIENLQIIFIISAFARLVPLFLLRFVHDDKQVTSRHLLAQIFKGNVLSYAFNATVYSMASAADTRARAALALGRSGNPLALEQLIQALADASPKVRSSAARALGETGSEQATQHLLDILRDGDSDIRPEAAEALGRLGHSDSVDQLIDALEDEDARVRISAIRGLAEMRGDEAQELLFWHFNERFDPRAFPTLVDVLSEMGDRRIIKPALQRMATFKSPAIRLQLLNSVCRALGAKGQFYELLSQDPDRRASTISRRFRRTGNALAQNRALDSEVREDLRATFARLVQAYESDNSDWVSEAVQQIAGIVRDGLSATGRPAYEVLAVFVVILALNDFLQSPVRHELPDAQEIFLAVCLQRLAKAIEELEVQEE